MDTGTLRIMLELMAVDMSGGAFGSFTMSILRATGLMSTFNTQGSQASAVLGIMIPAILGAGAAFGLFEQGTQFAISAGLALQNAGVMASIAISDGSQHVNELETAIVNLANTSQYKIADVDMAFRVLGGLGFTTGQILGGIGQEAIVMAQAMGGPGAGISAADAAQLLGQTLYLFQSRGLSAKQAADELTGAFYNNMMSVSDLQQFLGMAGGTASSLGVSFGQLLTFGSMLTPMFGSASSAGASLSYMMRNLAKPSTAAMADEIQSLGLQIYNSQGQFVGLKSIMDQLFQATQNMTQQQKMDVFGTLFNVRSGRAAMDMMNQSQASFDAMYQKISGRINQVGQAQRDSNAVNNTGIGVWNRLTTTLNDFFAKAGVGIITSLIPLENAFNSLLSMLQKNTGFEKFLSIFLVAGTAISGLALVVGVLVTAFVAFTVPMLIFSGVFLGIIVLAGLVAGAFMLISTHTTQARGVLSGILGVLDDVRSHFSILTPAINGVTSTVGGFLAQIGPPAHQLLNQTGQELGQLGTAFRGVWPIVQDTGQLLQWLWQNVLSGLLGFILGTFLNLLQGGFNSMGIFFGSLVSLIRGIVQAIFGVMQVGVGLLQVIFGTIIALLTGHVNQAGQIWTTGWQNIAHGVVNIAQGLGTSLLAILQGIFGTLWNFVSNAGLKLMQSLVQGILSGLGQVKNAIGSVAQTIADHLPHSPAKTGPLSGNTMSGWGPAITGALATGMLGSMGSVTNASRSVAGAVGSGFTTPGMGALQGAGLAANGQNQQYTVNMQVDGQTMAQTVFQVVNGQLRQNGYTRMNR